MNFSRIQNSNSLILIEAAQKLGIKIDLLDENKIKLRLSKNGQTHLVTKNSFGLNSSTAIRQTRNKKQTSHLLAERGIPTPREIELSSLSQLNPANLPPFPLVVKPAEGQKGHDVYIGITNYDNLQNCIAKTLKNNPSVIIQEFIPGRDTRFFVLNNQVIGLANRRPPILSGNGKDNLQQLVLAHNQNLLRERQKTGRRLQNRLLNWPRLIWHLENQGLSLATVPAKGQLITPYPIANFQAGGTVETLEKSVLHPSLIKLAEKTAEAAGLTVCGVDLLIKDYQKAAENNAYVLEVNSDPSLRLHAWPNRGNPQPVAQALLNFIFSA